MSERERYESVSRAAIWLELTDYPSPQEKPLKFLVKPNEVVAIFGPHETVVSDILKAAAGQEVETGVRIKSQPDQAVLYIPQDPTLLIDNGEDITVRELYWEKSGLATVEEKMQELERQMANDPNDSRTIEEYGRITEEYNDLKGWGAERKAKYIMQGLGLPESFDLERSIRAASSGEQAKLLLGMALFARPSVLILDDPSVHLDAKSKAWLAQYLKTSGQAVLISAYDPEFIESTATAVVGLTEDRGFFFSGDFSEFTEKVERVLLSERNTASALAKSIESLGETVQKMYANSKVSRSKEAARVRTVLKRRLDRMKADYQDLPGAERKRKRAKVRSFEIKERGGDNVVTIQRPTIKYEENIGVALPELSLTVIRGERLAIVGPNGSGKTTLAKGIAQAMREEKQPDEGRIIPGTSISTGYFSPDSAIQIEDQNTDLLSAAGASTSGVAENQARSILAYWVFLTEK